MSQVPGFAKSIVKELVLLEIPLNVIKWSFLLSELVGNYKMMTFPLGFQGSN